MRKSRNPVQAAILKVKKQPPKVKTAMAVMGGILALVLIRFVIHDHNNLFVAAELAHAVGVACLIYRLIKDKTCAGLSRKSQELTAIFLLVRLYCSFVMEFNVHTLLDCCTFLTTAFVIYLMRSNDEDLDNLPLYYVLAPCAMLAVLIHPGTTHHMANRILWAFCIYLEAVSVMPQLRVMQSARVVEPFTAHYVFAMGIARFLTCAHWILEVLDGSSFVLNTLGSGLWPVMVLLSEIVQTTILADFCYYYVKSVLDGQMMVRLPSVV